VNYSKTMIVVLAMALKQDGKHVKNREVNSRMNELKPCPFCGRTDTLHFDRYQSDGEWWGYIECTECIMTGPVGKLKKDAVDAWNRRAGEQDELWE
jgi:Lar family restriction alleviation protein